MITITKLKLNQLNAEQVKEIRELEQICQQNEGLKRPVFLSNEINFDKSIDCFYLLYDGEKLVSFLSLFIPMQNEAEVSAYTLPECRNKGYFHLLFQEAAAELKKFEITKILFVHEPTSKSAECVLKSYGASLSYSEYLLAFDSKDFQRHDSRLRLEFASLNEIPEMAALDSSLFDESYDESLSLLTKSLESDHIKLYCAFVDDKLIGLCNANSQDGKCIIYGVGIAQECQGKGYGREMLNLLLEQLIRSECGEITLEVSSTNAVAYNLYITSGFHPKTQYDYNTFWLKANQTTI